MITEEEEERIYREINRHEGQIDREIKSFYEEIRKQTKEIDDARYEIGKQKRAMEIVESRLETARDQQNKNFYDVYEYIKKVSDTAENHLEYTFWIVMFILFDPFGWIKWIRGSDFALFVLVFLVLGRIWSAVFQKDESKKT